MIATYRLQLHPDFGFADARALVPYLKSLGISHLYLSPITEARPGSTHGYDVIDHNAIRMELGGREEFDRLVAAARDSGLELILDFVPNHAGVGPLNSYWQDVLAYGPHSAFASYFDVDWEPIKPELQGKILLPFLGRPYGEVLDDGELQLTYSDGYFYASYYENRYRLNPASYVTVLKDVLQATERTAAYWDLKDLVEAYRTLRSHERDKAEALRRRLTNLFGRIEYGPAIEAVDAAALHGILEKQYWRLAFWKTAGYEINYRRFFDINGLVALRMEDEHVFWDAHQLLAEILAIEGVAGVRIDHVDGLFDPHRYLDRLRKVGAGRVWVEKILAPGETIPDAWPVAGTTGYEFLNDVMGVLVRRDARIPLEKIYRRMTGMSLSFDDEVYISKKDVIDSSLSSELFRLAFELDRISEADYHTRDYTLEALRLALTEVVALFDRYRTYLPYDEETAREVVQKAVYRARLRNPVTEPTVYDFIARVLLGDVREDLSDRRRAFVGRFQQYTAPVAAKGVEDTAFYRYLPLAALNEVGGEPGDFGQSLHAFHSRARFRAHRYPYNLLSTGTHDHKRGEDTRMRMIALSEMPDEWETVARSLHEIGQDHSSDAGPSLIDQYLFFQTVVALWHGSDRADLPDRLAEYMLKATRESKRQTSWTYPDSTYEEALEAFVRGMLADERLGPAIDDFARKLAEIGFRNSISQLVLKMTTPGVPDVYQGSELLDLTLVDPDNRRPIDYDLRSRVLDELKPLLDEPSAGALRELIEAGDERAKLYVTAALLRARRRMADLPAADYHPIELAAANEWIAFARTHGAEALVVVVRRWHGAAGEATPDERRAAEIPRAREERGDAAARAAGDDGGAAAGSTGDQAGAAGVANVEGGHAAPASDDQAGEPALHLPDELGGRVWFELLTGTRIEAGDAISTSHLPLPWGVLYSSGPSE